MTIYTAQKVVVPTEQLITDFGIGTFKYVPVSTSPNAGYGGTAMFTLVGSAQSANNGSYYEWQYLKRWDYVVDLTNIQEIRFHAKQNALHGLMIVKVTDGLYNAPGTTNPMTTQYTEINKGYNVLPTSWTEYTLDVRNITGVRTVSFIGGYVDPTGYAQSSTSYSNIRFYGSNGGQPTLANVQVKKMYRALSGVNREIKNVTRSVSGVNRVVFNSGIAITDEFNGISLDTSLWTYSGNASQYNVSGGTLNISHIDGEPESTAVSKLTVPSTFIDFDATITINAEYGRYLENFYYFLGDAFLLLNSSYSLGTGLRIRVYPETGDATYGSLIGYPQTLRVTYVKSTGAFTIYRNGVVVRSGTLAFNSNFIGKPIFKASALVVDGSCKIDRVEVKINL